MKKIAIVKIIAFLTIILFLYTGISKLMDYDVFREQISLIPLMHPFAGVIIWLLPVVEFVTVVLLIVPKWRIYGFFVAISLMLTFTIYFISLKIVDEKLVCSCGGVIELLSRKQHLIFNCTLILLEFTAIRLQIHIQSQQKLTV
jgi:hypothetical protein